MSEDIAAVLARLLASREVTVQRAANAAGCSRSHLSRVLHRQIRPSLTLAGRLDTALDADGELTIALLLRTVAMPQGSQFSPASVTHSRHGLT